VIRLQFQDAGEFSEGLAWVLMNGRFGYVEASGHLAIPATFAEAMPFSEGLATVKVGDRWGYIDKTGKIVVAARFESANDFSEGLARVSTGDQYGFIDRTGRLVIPERYGVMSGDFSEGLAPACIASLQCGYIDKTGTMVLAAQYRVAGEFRKGLAKVQTARGIGYIDARGRYVWQPSQ
jgi:hypothetical protein